MLINHVLGLLLNPREEWQSIKQEDKSIGSCYLELILILALIPPFAGFYDPDRLANRLGAAGQAHCRQRFANCRAFLSGDTGSGFYRR